MPYDVALFLSFVPACFPLLHHLPRFGLQIKGNFLDVIAIDVDRPTDGGRPEFLFSDDMMPHNNQEVSLRAFYQ